MVSFLFVNAVFELSDLHPVPDSMWELADPQELPDSDPLELSGQLWMWMFLMQFSVHWMICFFVFVLETLNRMTSIHWLLLVINSVLPFIQFVWISTWCCLPQPEMDAKWIGYIWVPLFCNTIVSTVLFYKICVSEYQIAKQIVETPVVEAKKDQ